MKCLDPILEASMKREDKVAASIDDYDFIDSMISDKEYNKVKEEIKIEEDLEK